MADYEDGRGWHGDPEGHAEAAEEGRKTNWLPLLLLPVAFLIGWLGKDAIDNNYTTNRDLSYESRPQAGIGGGPNEPCITPEAPLYR